MLHSSLFLQIELKVNKLSSTASALSYNYYDLAFCRVRLSWWLLAAGFFTPSSFIRGSSPVL